jgi:hypothetical protein
LRQRFLLVFDGAEFLQNWKGSNKLCVWQLPTKHLHRIGRQKRKLDRNPTSIDVAKASPWAKKK